MSRLEDFRVARWVKRLNRTLQILLSLSLAAALNLIAAKHFLREDITRTHRYSLAPETLAYLNQIEKPIRIIVTEPSENAPPRLKEMFEDIQNLLREFQYAARINGKPRIFVEYINIYKDSVVAEELVRKYNVKPEDQNAIIVASGEEFHRVFHDRLYEQDSIIKTVFTGEQAFTTAILNVMRPDKTMLYFTVGHREMSLDDVAERRGLSQLAEFLQRRNFRAQELNLTKVEAVPEDADVVIVTAPQQAFFPEEQEKLRNYLDDGDGRLMIFLDPARPHGLDDLFYDWGLLADDMIILEASQKFQTSGGDMLIGQYAEHPTTELMRINELPVNFGLSSPVRIDPGSPLDDRLQVVELLRSSPMSWAERNYRVEPSQYDQQSDLPGPVSLAVISERVTGSDLGLDLQGGRLAVFGNAAWIGNGKINSGANTLLYYNILNWMLEREEMVNISPRVIERHQLLISQNDLHNIYIWLLILPGGIALLGIMILILRRR